MMNKLTIIATAVFFMCNMAVSQNFLNGSFEITTAPVGCNYNLPNNVFNSYVSNVTAFAGGVNGGEVDLCTTGCYSPSVPDGIRFISLARIPVDEVSLKLSTSLVPGTPFTFTFWHRGDPSFNPLGSLEVGYSTTATNFGSLVFTTPVPTTTWVMRTVTFTPTVSADYITIRNVSDGVTHWNFVDDFRTASPLPVGIKGFDYTCNDGVMEVVWDVETEYNCDKYEVLTSSDGKTYDVSCAVPALKLNYYSCTIDKKEPVYVIVNQYDNDGAKSVFGPFWTACQDEDLLIYPNPSESDLVWIKAPEDFQRTQISVLDMSGRVIRLLEHNFSVLNTIEIQIDGLESGKYMVKIVDATNMEHYLTFIVE